MLLCRKNICLSESHSLKRSANIIYYMTFRILVLTFFVTNLYAQKNTKVAIIGGGMAGVAAAHYIQAYDSSAQITLFEKEAVMGGNAQTVAVRNARNEEVMVDAGPQYFTEGPWDEYIAFLKSYGEYDLNQISGFGCSLAIQKQGSKRPKLLTPLHGSLRGEKLGKLIKLKRFFDAAYKVYKNPETDYPKHIGKWVSSLAFDSKFEAEVLYPFLAASLGTDVPGIKQTATLEIIKLFAFRKPSNKNTFSVMHKGMGTLIRNVAGKLAVKGVEFRTASPVKQIEKSGEEYIVRYTSAGAEKQEEFDFVVLAVHADQAYWLLKEEPEFSPLLPILKDLNYFKAHIVLHKDSSVVNNQKPAFLNILTNSENQLIASTMNLEMIDSRYQGVYKSWFTDSLTAKVKANGTFLHESVFNHPLITPEFNLSLEKLRNALLTFPKIAVCGGWSEGLETQESAIISGKKALEKYQQFKVRLP